MSITRRRFLQSAMSVACVPLLSARLLQFDRVIFDARRSHALAFAAEAQRFGATTQALNGDIHDHWFQRARERWCARRAPVAGMTDFRSLFLLQTMAADAGLLPLLRIHHGTRGAALAHETFGAPAYRAMSDAHLANCGECWAQAAARLLSALPDHGANTRPYGDLAEANLRSLDSTALVTWVMV